MAMSGQLPPLVEQCIDFLKDHLREGGLFRKSAPAHLMAELKQKFDSGRPFVLSSATRDPHVVAGLLKLYFRELREPVFPRHLQREFQKIDDEDDDAKQLDMIRALLRQFPRFGEFYQLKCLFLLLKNVTRFAAENMMSNVNLAVCWTPSLFHAGTAATDITAMMIEHYDFVFGMTDVNPVRQEQLKAERLVREQEKRMLEQRRKAEGLKAKPKKGEEGYELYEKEEAEEMDAEMELLPGVLEFAKAQEIFSEDMEGEHWAMGDLKAKLAEMGLHDFDVSQMSDPIVANAVKSALKSMDGPIRKVEPGRRVFQVSYHTNYAMCDVNTEHGNMLLPPPPSISETAYTRKIRYDEKMAIIRAIPPDDPEYDEKVAEVEESFKTDPDSPAFVLPHWAQKAEGIQEFGRKDGAALRPGYVAPANRPSLATAKATKYVKVAQVGGGVKRFGRYDFKENKLKVVIEVPVPNGTTRDNVQLQVQANHIIMRILINGNVTSIVEGELAGKANPKRVKVFCAKPGVMTVEIDKANKKQWHALLLADAQAGAVEEFDEGDELKPVQGEQWYAEAERQPAPQPPTRRSALPPVPGRDINWRQHGRSHIAKRVFTLAEMERKEGKDVALAYAAESAQTDVEPLARPAIAPSIAPARRMGRGGPGAPPPIARPRNMTGGGGVKAIALFDFAAGQDGDLGFLRGDQIEVLDMSQEWWKGLVRTGGGVRTGIFPKNYVKLMDSGGAAAAPPPVARPAGM